MPKWCTEVHASFNLNSREAFEAWRPTKFETKLDINEKIKRILDGKEIGSRIQADDIVFIQVGAFYERLRCLLPGQGRTVHFPNQSIVPGLRPMRPNARGAIEGFPIDQLKTRIQPLVAAGLTVLLIRQSLAKSVDLVLRQPARRWVPREAA